MLRLLAIAYSAVFNFIYSVLTIVLMVLLAWLMLLLISDINESKPSLPVVWPEGIEAPAQ